MTKKASTDTRCSDAKYVETEEMRTIKKLIPERNDSSTRVASKLSSLQKFSAVISLLEGELGLRIDGSAPSITILCEGNSSLYRQNFSTAPLETRSDVDIRAQLRKRVRLAIGVQYRFRPVSYHNINVF